MARCPICSDERPDYAELRWHISDAHGAGPAMPAPAEPAMIAPAALEAQARRGWDMGSILICGVALIVALAVVGIGVLGSSTHSHPSASQTPATNGGNQVILPAGELAAALPSGGEVGPAWAMFDNAAASDGDLLTTAGCSAPGLADVDAAAETLAWKYSNTGRESAFMGVAIHENSSLTNADKQRSYLATPSHDGCEQQYINEDARKRWGVVGGSAPSDWSVAPAPIQLHSRGAARYLTTRLEDARGDVITASYALLDQFSGIYEAETLVTWCSCDPLPPAHLEAVAASIANHLATLPAGQPAADQPVLAANDLPVVTGVAPNTDPAHKGSRVVHVDWRAFSQAPIWVIETDKGAIVERGAPPADVLDTAANGTGYRAVVCTDDCDVAHPPPASVGPGVAGPWVVGPWISTASQSYT